MNYGEKYGNFNSLLLGFLEQDEIEDIDIIKEEIQSLNPKSIKLTINEAKEVLELEPFPEEWVWDIAGRGPKLLFDTTKEWIEWVVEKFEEEAKKAGKL